MIFTNNVSPPSPTIPRDENNAIDWLKVKRQHPGDWYGTTGWPTILEEYRIWNLWPMYAVLTAMGYGYYAKCAITSICWFASGLDGGIWGSGSLIYHGETAPDSTWNPVPNQPDTWTKYYRTIPTNNYTSDDVRLGNGDYEWPTWPTLPEGSSWGTTPAYGIVQWTPYTNIKDMVTADGATRSEDWSHYWAQNTSLQMLMLNWQRQNYHTLGQLGQWMDNWFSPADITTNYRCVNMTWDDFYDDSDLSWEFDLPETNELVTTDLGKFDLQCYTWLGHYINAGSAQLDNDLANRHSVYNNYIKDAFTTWDNNGGAGLLDVPFPYGTYLDDVHMLLWPLLEGRKRKNVRTILL